MNLPLRPAESCGFGGFLFVVFYAVSAIVRIRWRIKSFKDDTKTPSYSKLSSSTTRNPRRIPSSLQVRHEIPVVPQALFKYDTKSPSYPKLSSSTTRNPRRTPSSLQVRRQNPVVFHKGHLALLITYSYDIT